MSRPRSRPSLHHPLALAAAAGIAAAGAAAPISASTGAPASAAPAAHAQQAAPTFSHSRDRLVLHVPATNGAPGYSVRVHRSPFRLTTVSGGRVVLRTAGGKQPAFATTGTAEAGTTDVTDYSWQDGTLHLTVATDQPGQTLQVALDPGRDRYRLTTTAQGGTGSVGVHYLLHPSGHWYGHGEAVTDKEGPYKDQPWPLDGGPDSGKVADDSFGPAAYNMVEPFWFTQAGSGIWVDTDKVMNTSIDADDDGLADLTVTDGDTLAQTVFVERTPRKVFEDYIGIAGAPKRSDAPDYQYRTPVWNSWAQFYTDVTQDSFLQWARGIHRAHIPAHTFNLDDGWMSHYGDFTFNDKFPDPGAMSDAIHKMGSRFGLWVTLWINTDADNYQLAKDKGYLLASKDDPSQPCTVEWWNGQAGIVDLANPDARAWYVGQLHDLMKRYGVDGFKFDTRFFDDKCAPYSSDLTRGDYQKLGADMADEFDLQGMGIRVHWTGSQQHGFVMRQIDKSTDWASLNAAVSQNLALSTVGYPFVTTDMIGGSDAGFPASKRVLVRWAQAAAAMPLMYSSTSPLGVKNFAGSRSYDARTVQLYRAAVKLHQGLAPYILRQVHRAVGTGEPIMKPIFFDFPGDQRSYGVDDEWLLGDSLLVAPVLDKGSARDITLPGGRWYDVARKRVVRGPVVLRDHRADLATVPLFVRLGTHDTGRLMRALAPGHHA